MNFSIYELQTIRDSLSDYKKSWTRYIDEAKLGDRPNMNLEGANMIMDDIESSLDKVINELYIRR